MEMYIYIFSKVVTLSNNFFFVLFSWRYKISCQPIKSSIFLGSLFSRVFFFFHFLSRGFGFWFDSVIFHFLYSSPMSYFFLCIKLVLSVYRI